MHFLEHATTIIPLNLVGRSQLVKICFIHKPFAGDFSHPAPFYHRHEAEWSIRVCNNAAIRPIPRGTKRNLESAGAA
jgi:hypothetical protein